MLSAYEELQLDLEIQREIEKQLNEMKDKVEEIFRDVIVDEVYQYYTPNTYERTETLLNSVRARIVGDKLFINPDINEGMGYHSVVDGSDQSANIVNYVFNGHDDGIGDIKKGYNQFHRYEDRNVLEVAYERLKLEFPDYDIEIINDNKGYSDVSDYL